MEIECILKEIKSICSNFNEEVTLFGSWVKGTARDRSDIDVAVNCDEHTFDKIEYRVKQIDTLRKIDLVNLKNCKKQNFIEEIKQYGKIL